MYGRQRLLALSRVLPHVRGARVHLLGPGLPSFWVLDLGGARLTVALTSWSGKWASTASFDALMPGEGASEDAERAVLAPRPRSAAAGRPGARARPHAGGDPHRPAAGVSARPGAR
ncbi:MAG: hypothetical protein R3F59_21060 [Myxococcota bacterium]